MKRKFELGDRVIINPARKKRYRKDIRFSVGKVVGTKHTCFNNRVIYLVNFKDIKHDYCFEAYELIKYIGQEKIITEYAPEEVYDMLYDACECHEKVNQTYGDRYVYGYHLTAVLNVALKYATYLGIDTNTLKIIAFGACFHDTIEDARLTYNDVLKYARKYFGKEDAVIATEIVYALTNEKGRTRAERANEKYYAGIRETPFAPFVKACDRIANYSFAKSNGTSMAKKYEQEMDEFLSHIIVKTDDARFLIPYNLIHALKNNIVQPLFC